MHAIALPELETQASPQQADWLVTEMLRRLDDAQHPHDALNGFFEVSRQLGVGHIVFGHSPTMKNLDGSWSVPSIMTCNVPDDWDADVREIRWADPFYHACFAQRHAVDWDMVREDPCLLPYQREFIARITRNGLTSGVTVPIRLPYGAITFLSYLGSDEDAAFATALTAHRSVLLLLAYNFLTRMNARFQQAEGAAAQLGPRELECLRWSAMGKSNPEIAQIIGISAETVRVHLKRSFIKLNANNRCHAAAKAIQLGLFEIDF